jgi:hypothetical protein
MFNMLVKCLGVILQGKGRENVNINERLGNRLWAFN